MTSILLGSVVSSALVLLPLATSSAALLISFDPQFLSFVGQLASARVASRLSTQRAAEVPLSLPPKEFHL